jgi:GNAT superfamily N-acetyltransferase
LATEDFDAFLEIYKEALPARERKSAAALRAMCSSPDYSLVLATRAETVVGFFIVYRGRTMALLEYMAVRNGLRGAGIGAALYGHARAVAGSVTPMLMEVDSDRELSADRAVRARRKEFYRRCGARLVEGLDYVLPLPGEGAPARMDLLVDGAVGDTVAKELVASWLREIYQRVYACTADDARLLAMIGSLQANVRIV